jgi:flagellar biosynthesis/type III secretory pathway M-ring protein FliF/YscJ
MCCRIASDRESETTEKPHSPNAKQRAMIAFASCAFAALAIGVVIVITTRHSMRYLCASVATAAAAAAAVAAVFRQPVPL